MIDQHQSPKDVLRRFNVHVDKAWIIKYRITCSFIDGNRYMGAT